MARSHSKVKCPDCGGSPFCYSEVSLQVHDFAADESGIEETGELESSTIQYVIACCGSCKREWKLRGIRQIDDLRENEG